MFSKVLVAYDEGNVAQKALDKAIGLAQCTGAEIFIISVYGMNTVQSWGLSGHQYPADADKLFNIDNSTAAEAEAKYLEQVLRKPAEKARQAGLAVHCAVLGGKPGAAIIEYAKNIGAGVIVMGTHNRGPAVRFVLGSTAHEIIHTAPCPVMVVRE